MVDIAHDASKPSSNSPYGINELIHWFHSYLIKVFILTLDQYYYFKDKFMIVALSGLHGTGKSTVGKLVADSLHLKFYSTGMAFRELAKEMDMSLEEFTHYVEANPSIDEQLDAKIIEIAKKGDVLIESQLSGYILKDIADVKILLTAPLEIRIERIAKRDGVSIEKSRNETLLREASEHERFKKLYNIDLNDKSVFDLIIDTSSLTIEQVTNLILQFIKSHCSSPTS
ncbi:MAG: (d)CMP kinase [Promethearchaeota archaeon]